MRSSWGETWRHWRGGPLLLLPPLLAAAFVPLVVAPNAGLVPGVVPTLSLIALRVVDQVLHDRRCQRDGTGPLAE